MGPAPVTETAGLDIGPHPHTGLQTVTWLLSGEVLHRDSLGTAQLIRAGQLNLMTAGHGVAHSEEATGHYRGQLHGVQLWVAQPERTRHGAAAFEHHAELPRPTSATPAGPSWSAASPASPSGPAGQPAGRGRLALRRGRHPLAAGAGVRVRAWSSSTARSWSTAPPVRQGPWPTWAGAATRSSCPPPTRRGSCSSAASRSMSPS